MNMRFLGLPKARCGRWGACLGVLIILFGCGPMVAVPTSYNEIKAYCRYQKQSFAHPLRLVLLSSAAGLAELEFVPEYLEHMASRGWIEAANGKTRVTLRLAAVTPRLTEVHVKITTDRGWRHFSSEVELFQLIRSRLEDNAYPSLPKLTAGMTRIHASPDHDSAVVAYAAAGSAIEIDDTGLEWNRVQLKTGGVGYIPAESVALLPVEKSAPRRPHR